MPLFRHSAIVLQQETMATTDIEGRVWRIRPAEGDAVTDPIQDWRCQIVAERAGAGGVTITLQTSYDREIWVDVASGEAGAEAEIALIPAIDVLAPFVRAHARLSPAPVGETSPSYRTRVRLVSNGPFKLEPV
jgi:hypothetical protein